MFPAYRLCDVEYFPAFWVQRQQSWCNEIFFLWITSTIQELIHFHLEESNTTEQNSEKWQPLFFQQNGKDRVFPHLKSKTAPADAKSCLQLVQQQNEYQQMCLKSSLQGSWTRLPLRVPFNSNVSMILWVQRQDYAIILYCTSIQLEFSSMLYLCPRVCKMSDSPLLQDAVGAREQFPYWHHYFKSKSVKFASQFQNTSKSREVQCGPEGKGTSRDSIPAARALHPFSASWRRSATLHRGQ